MTKFLNNADVKGYISQTSVTSSLLKTDANGKLVAATAGTDYVAPSGLSGYVPYTGATENVDLGEYNIKSGAFKFDLTPSGTVAEGTMQWNSSDGTVDIGLKGGNVVLQVGQETVYEVRNETGTQIPNGTAVYANGVTAGSGRITSAPYVADGSVRENRFLGLATENISNGVNGFVTHFGYVRGLDTRGTSSSSISVGDETWAVGDILYVHPTVAGKLTNVKPQHEITVAIIITRHQSSGVLFVRPSSAGHLEDIHDVAISSVANNDLFVYESATSVWKNKTIATVLGYTPVDASLTANYVPKATGATTLTNSNIQDSGSLITLGSNSYVNGALGVGTSSLTGYNLRVSKNITGGTTAYGVQSDGQIQSDVTSNAHLFRSAPSTQATAFTLSSLNHYTVFPVSVGAGSAITFQRGFWVTSLTGATANYGFVGDIAAASNAWNLYMSGSANNYLAGSLGIGTTSLTGYNLRMQKAITGTTQSFGMEIGSTINSDVTTQAVIYGTAITTQAATFTLSALYHYIANATTFGAGSTVTNQFGFYVQNTLTGATNNYGFYGNIPAGTNRWNLYMNGTANNYLAGSLGVGTTNLTAYNLRVSKNITGATTSTGISSEGIIQSVVTTWARLYNTYFDTVAAAFTLTNVSHYITSQGVIGAGSTVTNQHGFYVDSTLTGATNNYGFYGNIASGTNRWNLYMAGTAQNYLAGALSIGVTTANASALLQVDSTTKGFLPPRMTAAQRTAIGTPATGLIVYQTDGVEGLWINTSTGWRELTVV
jgi:hypothetical protein